MRRLSIIDLVDRPPADSQRGPDGLDRLQRRDLQLPRAARASSRLRATASTPARTPRSIVHAYEQWGAAAIRRLRGMFGLAIWDARTRTLLLARDRVGIKPLHYATAGGRLYFGSELKSLLCGAGPAARSRSRRARSLPVVPLHAARRVDLHGRPQAAARAPADVARRTREDRAVLAVAGRRNVRAASEADAVDAARAACWPTPSART